MKSRFLFAVFLLVFGLSYSQKQAPEKAFSFKIDGTVKKFEGKTVYLHHKWDGDHTDSAKVIKGKFTFNLKSVDPNMYWFTLTNDINAQPNYIFFADAGLIKITLLGDSLGYSSIEAGQSQKDYVDYRMMIANFISIQQKMQADYSTAMQNNDITTQNAIKAEYQNLNGQFIDGLKSFVRTHPKSAVSGYVIYTDFNNPNIPLKDAEEALSYIDKSVQNTKFIMLANKRLDMLRGTTVGYKANDFTQAAPDGKKISLSDFKGKYVLVDFWASWCRPCRMENPNVVSAYNRFKDKGFTVLGVSLDHTRDPWLMAIQQDNLTWTHVSDLQGWGNEAAKLYGVTGIPQNFLIDKEGKIVAKDLRGPALDEKLAELIK